MDGYGNVGGLGTLVWVFTAALLFLVVIASLASRGIIRLNVLLGIRIPSVLRSEKAWETGHAAALPGAWTGFAGALICAVIGLFYPVAHWGVVIFFVGTVIWTLIAASRAALTVD